MSATAPRPTTRRRRSPGWVPNQHGAWAMLVLPVVVGALRGGPRWVHLLLLVAWLVAYLAFYATGLWLRAARKPRYRPPVLAYGAVTAAVGGSLLLLEPQLVRWGVVYAPLLAASLAFSARRAERALANDVVTMVAASLMTVVAHGLGTEDEAWLPGAASAEAWAVAGLVLAYLVGTALYVKTMIRERGNRVMYAASVGYHAVLAATLLWMVPAVGLLFVALTARAAVVPRWWPTARPATIGIGEIVASVVLAALLLAAPLG